jgi:putative ABC transport system permease protein
MSGVILILVIFFGILLGGVGLVVALMLGLSVVLLVVLALQAVGLLRRVPFSYNFRNLRVRWVTTLLTALAFTLVVGLMTVMLAFVNGMYRLTQGSGRPSNVMVLSDGATDELFSDLGRGDITRIEQEPGIARDEDGKPLVSWETYAVVNQPVASDPSTRRFIQVRGVEDPSVTAQVHGLELYPGGSFPDPKAGGVRTLPGERQEVATQAVLGEGIARLLGQDLGKPSLEVGDLFDLGDGKWVVEGVLRSAGSTFDSEVWAKRQRVGELFGKDTYTTVVLSTPDAESARALADDLEANFKDPALNAQPETEYFATLNTTNQQFLYAILFVAGVIAIGGVFGVMNTMFAAISQRTQDIGVMRILGFTRWQVLTSFFFEALLLALIGGALGCALGTLADGWQASSIVSGGQGAGKSIMLKLVVDWRILLAGMGFSLLMGCLGGLLPSLSAMRLKPLESVR